MVSFYDRFFKSLLILARTGSVSKIWLDFGLACISTSGVCELALLVKLQESTSYESLVVFLEFFPVDQAEISHMNTPQNSSR